MQRVTARIEPGLFHHADGKTAEVERFALASSHGAFVVEKDRAFVDAGDGEVVMTRSALPSLGKESERSMRMTTSKLTILASSLLGAKALTFDRMVAEGVATRMEILESGKDPVRAQGDRVEYDRAASLVTISAAAGRRVYLVSPQLEGDFRELRYDPAKGLWDLPGAFVRLEGPKK